MRHAVADVGAKECAAKLHPGMRGGLRLGWGSGIGELSLGTLLDWGIRRVTDFTGVGEISPKGSISWSDPAEFDRVAESLRFPRN
jgi:hypothetical protein